MTPILFDTNQVPYQEEKFSNFIEADEDEIDAGNDTKSWWENQLIIWETF